MTTKEKQAAGPPSSEIEIEVTGAGLDARRIARTRGWEFSEWEECADGEMRMRDTDGAKKLGFKKPADVRELIVRTFEGEKLAGIYVRRSLRTTQMPTGGMRSTEIREYWLTEAQWLKVIARSRTDVADAILDEMIAVYMAVRRGLLPRQSTRYELPAAVQEALLAIPKLQQALVAQRAEIDDLKRLASNDVGEVGREWAKRNINGPLMTIATLELGKDADKKALLANYMRLQRLLRHELFFVEKGSHWWRLSRDARTLKTVDRWINAKRDEALRTIRETMKEQAVREAREAVKARMEQLGLAFPPTDKPS